MGWYKTGSVTLAQGNVLVVGAGTDFITNVSPGGIFCGPDGRMYEVDFVTSATALQLVKPYAGQSAGGAAYAVAPTQSYVVELAKQATALLNTFGGFRDAYLAGDLVGAGLELKGILSDASQLPAGAADGDTYLINGSLHVWSKTKWSSGSIQGPKGETGDVNPANLAAAVSAADSKTQAATSATLANESKNSAAASATASSASATAARSSETAAAASLAGANSARDQAVTSATNAAGSAATASNAAASVVASLASFRAVFLGELPSDPARDGNGNALQPGAEYFNTVEQKLRIYTVGGWQDYDATAQSATQNAILSAANAGGSATFAATSADTASTAATAAAASAANASGSATTATTAAGTATAQATTATNKASAAAASESNAATSAASASASAATATGAASTATAQAAVAVEKAGIAVDRASAAAASAGGAATSATSASTSASAAATSAAGALASELHASTAQQTASNAADVATGKASAAAASAAEAAYSAQQAASGGYILSVAGRRGDIVLTTADLTDYLDPVTYSIALGD